MVLVTHLLKRRDRSIMTSPIKIVQTIDPESITNYCSLVRADNVPRVADDDEYYDPLDTYVEVCDLVIL
jgi:hypothetical protein